MDVLKKYDFFFVFHKIKENFTEKKFEVGGDNRIGRRLREGVRRSTDVSHWGARMSSQVQEGREGGGWEWRKGWVKVWRMMVVGELESCVYHGADS